MKWLLWAITVTAAWLALVLWVIWLVTAQAVPVLPDPDAFYHIGMAQHLWQFGLADHFTGLQPTTLGQHFTDHHLLLHLLMYPYVNWIGPVVGTKVFAVLAIASVVTLFAYVMRKLGTHGWWIATILLAVCNPWVFRLQLIKATPLALLLLLLAVLVLHLKKPYWLILISAVYVLSHGGFILLPGLVGLWCLAETIANWRAFNLRTFWKPYLAVLYTLAGTAVMLLIHPAFPQNLSFYWEQVVEIGAVNYQHTIGVGGEWYPYDPAALWFGHLPLVLVAFVAVVVHVLLRRRFTTAQLAFTLYTAFFVLLTFKSKRYVEYVSPMLAASAGLYLESLWHITYQRWQATTFLPLAAVVVVLVPVLLNDMSTVHRDLSDGQPVGNYAGASTYLNSLPAGQTVAPSDWDDFPALWRGAPQQQYLIGLDPTFLYLANTERYDAWKRLTLGEVVSKADLAVINAQYYVVAKDHRPMYEHLVDHGAQLVYEDTEVWVLQYSPN